MPWDGVAVHPYFLDADNLFSIINEFARKVLDRGDSKSRIWITEVGAEAGAPDDRLDVSGVEVEVARSGEPVGICAGCVAVVGWFLAG